jgi:hypothetical protein
MFAFGATAALAVTLNRPVPAPTGLTAARQQSASACAPAELAMSLARGAWASGSRYHVEFTNTSGSACTLSGYPRVAAYVIGRHDYVQVGNAALREAADGASRVLLRPGGTAHSDVDIFAVAQGGACRPVTAAGLWVVPPGAARPRYLRIRLTACSAVGPNARNYLHVWAIAPSAGSVVVPSAVDPRTPGHQHAGRGRAVA